MGMVEVLMVGGAQVDQQWRVVVVTMGMQVEATGLINPPPTQNVPQSIAQTVR